MLPHRRQLHRINRIGEARYLTCSCYQRLPLLNHPSIRDLFVRRLAQVQQEEGFALLAWVVMPEHIHLLILPTDGQVSRILRRLKTPLAMQVIQRWRERNANILQRLTDVRGTVRFWQPGGGYDRNIIGRDELIQKIDYIHANPVRRGLVDSPCDWFWSSARAYAGMDMPDAGPVIACLDG